MVNDGFVMVNDGLVMVHYDVQCSTMVIYNGFMMGY